MNIAKNVTYIEKDEISYEELGLTQIKIYPHLDFKNSDYLKEVFKFSKIKY